MAPRRSDTVYGGKPTRWRDAVTAFLHLTAWAWEKLPKLFYNAERVIKVMEHPTAPTIIDPCTLLLDATHAGPIWSLNSEQLNINLLRFGTGEGIPPHANNEVDVLLVIVEGEGMLMFGDEEHQVHAGAAVLIPRGTRRAIRCTSGTLAYLSCHRRRGGLMPS
jgi:quercetin dioxygenase-like cupin family protein